jgi:glycosyltransferase involved in cell wall biosynthesis
MNVGGPAVQVSGLMRHLDQSLFEQRLITGYVGDDEEDFLLAQAPDVEAFRLSGLGRAVRPGDDARSLNALRRIVAEFKPDVIHTHTAKAGALGRVAAKTSHFHGRVVHTFHGHLLHGYFTPSKTKAVVLMERGLARISDALVAVGPQVRDDLLAQRIGRPGQYSVIEPGVALLEHPTKAQARLRLGVEPTGPVISVVGRITAIKRPDRMIEVISNLHAQVPGIQVLVAGDGEARTAAEQQAAALGLPVRFLGWRGDVETVLAASDLTLLTSDNEGTPLSLIQAALLGVPAVASDVGSVRHIVEAGSTGWLAAPTTGGLTRAVLDACSSPTELQVRGQRAQERAHRLYTVSRLAQDHETLYLSLMN